MSPDKNHIHHKLLNLGLTHKRSTGLIISYFLFIIAVAYFLRHMDVNRLLAVIMTLGFIGAYLPIFLLRFKKD